MKFYSSSSLKFFYVSLTILLSFASSVISQPDFLSSYCFENETYTNNSTYQTNLNYLFTTINSNTQIDYGYYRFSSEGNSDRAHAFALCRGDVNLADCRRCVNDSTHKLTQVCPYHKKAIGWYDNCMLRYSTSSHIFYTTTFEDPSFSIPNTQNVTSTTQFRTALRELMVNLSSIASLGDSRRKFATGEVSVTDSKKIYGLVQCTPDLTKLLCSICIDETVGMFRGCCDKTTGLRFFGASCNVRFDIYKFFQTVVAPIVPPPKTKASDKHSKGKSPTIIISVVSVVASVVLIVFICIYLRSRKPKRNVETMNELLTTESLQWNFSTIKFATDDFSDANKLGQGGFGTVYKGKLWDQKEIAVKRLAIGSGQGHKEFKTEITLVAKLQHINLVKLLGFCLEGDERLLIYEFVPNKSLDNFLFDKVKRFELDWKTRYKIIGGIVKGLLYLHEDSHLRIIHRDLKASNILLDEEMNPKIADFGLARLLVNNQTQGDTRRIVGTYGYMAPEYAMRGHFSVKTDVYSFGVLVLEIVSGLKNTRSFQNNEMSEDLISYAWESWKNGAALNLADPTLRGGSNSEITRCIHIGLLSVQENVSDRPTMASIAMMLNRHSINLPVPSQPSSYYMPNPVQSDSTATTGSEISQNVKVPSQPSLYHTAKHVETDSSVATGSDNSRNVNIVGNVSVNNMSITEVHPR